MSTQIEINYLDPTKPKGGKGSVLLGEAFHFFSRDGEIEVQFIGNSPIEPQREGRLPGKQELRANKTGMFRFRCFLHRPDGIIALDPDKDVGGELEVRTS